MPATPQPRPSAADQLDRLTPRWDDLVRRARLARSPADYDEAEAMGQALAREIRAAFRTSAPVNPPARVSPCGTKALW